MRELNVNEVQKVNGGIAAVGWILYGAYVLVRTYPRASAIGTGIAAGWYSEAEDA
ncbi:hypothetical protein [Thalassotalea aquiviva]|uniref:hypothetical protein n=1 Tax=Thalassotalea aquiviva TaxID=3242415 RepID=UPI00352A2C40